MKTTHLFEEVTSISNLLAAFKLAAKCKRGKKKEVFDYELNLGFNLYKLQEALVSGGYRVLGYKKFNIYEPKKRIIYAPYFEDLIVQFAIYNIVNPFFEKTFIYHAFSCRKNKGTQLCRDYVRTCISKSNPNNYILKLDIRKFFYSMDREYLKKEINRTIRDGKLCELMYQFVDDFETDKGVPIGNLLSQLFSNVYLRRFDHFAKRELKVKKYCRYVDDILLIDLSKEELLYCIDMCERFVDSIGLQFSEVRSQKCKRVLNYVGFLHTRNSCKIRKRSFKRFKQQIKYSTFEMNKNADKLVSYISLANGTNSLKTMNEILDIRYSVYEIKEKI